MTAPAQDPLRDVSAARLPAAGLGALAAVRNRDGVGVLQQGETVWVFWPAGRQEVVRCLLAVPGVVFFARRDGNWFRFGSLVPTGDEPPAGEGRPIAAVLVPARFEPLAPEPHTLTPFRLTVVRGGAPKPATALLCTVNDLLKWADEATTAELTAVRAARCGDRAILLGSRLPVLASATRFWGKDVLVRIGFRAEPALNDDALREAVGVTGEELLLLDETGAEVIPRVAFEPLTRAGVRLGARES